MRLIAITCFAILTISLAIHCAKPSRPEEPLYYVKTPMPDEEAELMALYVSSEVVAPQYLYERVQKELREIREGYADESPAISDIEYIPRFGIASYLSLQIDEQVYKQITSGKYHAWDSINHIYHMEDFVARKFYSYNIWYVNIHFQGRRNPEVMAQSYLALPGFLEQDKVGSFDRSNIYPRMTGDTISYLFRTASGDCMVGCTHNEFWYFVTAKNTLAYIGYWLPGWPDPEIPDWWDDADKNWYDFWERSFIRNESW